MKETLESKGWIMYYECVLRCGHKKFFNNPNYKGYEVIVKGNLFNVTLNNSVIAGPLYAYQLEETLKKLKIDN